MQGKHWLVVVSMLALAACEWKQRNEYHCPGGSECPPPGGFCEDSAQCGAPTPVCDEDNMSCVECLENGDCATSRPICSAEKTCVECEQHATCESRLCLANQTCADPADVAYVDGAAAPTNAACSLDMPCATMQEAIALVPSRKYIKATGMISSGTTILIDRKMVSIFGEPGMTTITRTAGGSAPVFDIRHESVVTLVDLEIIGAADGHVIEMRDTPGSTVSMTRVNLHTTKDNGIQVTAGRLEMTESQVSKATLVGINLTAGSLVMSGSRVFDNLQEGIKAASGTMIEINRSSITGNKGTAGVLTTDANMVTIEASTIALNTGTKGGVSITGRFAIRNSIIARNGGANSTTGGLDLSSTNGVLEFNTIANNVVGSGTGGISCSGTIAISSNILTNNGGDVDNRCQVTYSLTGTMGVPLDGVDNMTGDPMFIDDTDPSSSGFFRIKGMSAARDKGDSSLPVDVDIDGQARDDGMKDMGADEFKP